MINDALSLLRPIVCIIADRSWTFDYICMCTVALFLHFVLFYCINTNVSDVYEIKITYLLTPLVGHRTCDSQVAGSSHCWAPLCSGLGQATYTGVPLSPRSIILYWSKGDLFGWEINHGAGLVESDGSLAEPTIGFVTSVTCGLTVKNEISSLAKARNRVWDYFTYLLSHCILYGSHFAGGRSLTEYIRSMSKLSTAMAIVFMSRDVLFTLLCCRL